MLGRRGGWRQAAADAPCPEACVRPHTVEAERAAVLLVHWLEPPVQALTIEDVVLLGVAAAA
eukprot:7137952-Pyramimonas_sp.AAC.1